jgi:hypothetical protein
MGLPRPHTKREKRGEIPQSMCWISWARANLQGSNAGGNAGDAGAVRGGSGLWERYDNGDNLLFREEDLRNPPQSALFRELVRVSEALKDINAVAFSPDGKRFAYAGQSGVITVLAVPSH